MQPLLWMGTTFCDLAERKDSKNTDVMSIATSNYLRYWKLLIKFKIPIIVRRKPTYNDGIQFEKHRDWSNYKYFIKKTLEHDFNLKWVHAWVKDYYFSLLSKNKNEMKGKN